jgi:hypothetical protein
MDMRRFAPMLVLALAWPLVAAGDASVGPNAAPRGECDWEKGPFWIARNDPALQKIRDRLKLELVHATARHALYSRTQHGGLHQHESVVIDRASGRELARFYGTASALVENAAGEVVALVGIDFESGELSLLEPTGAVRWRHPQERWDDSAAAVLDGERLIVARFHRFATGSRLFAFDFKTGAPRWKGDVEQLNVSHSEYFNDVELALANGQVTMHGLEAGGCYVQTFDAVSGRRIASRKWNKW